MYPLKCFSRVKILLILFQVRDQIHSAGYYVDIDISDKTINKKVKIVSLGLTDVVLVLKLSSFMQYNASFLLLLPPPPQKKG